MTVKYLVGGGVESNVQQNKIQRVTKVEFDEDLSAFDDGARNLYSTVKNSLAVDNEQPATGGRGSETLEERRTRVRAKTPFGFKNIVRTIDFIYKRVIPKLPIFKNIYFSLTGGNNRVISKPETLGRIISCGFSVLEYFEYNNLLYVISKKIKEPDYNMSPSYGPLFKMNRVGFKGEIIGVY